MALDTLAMQRRLRDAGLDDQLAGVITREIADSVTSETAVKPDLSDLQEVRNELKADNLEIREKIAQLESKIAQLESKIAQLESKIADLANEIAGLRNIMADSKVSNARWAIGLIATMALGFTGVILALVAV
ncbi:MAG: hypothetical protein OXL37_04030 [Chloroflexota bacterium]|nr:hypothetical protein [Chloroflexota bacterium]MDE2958512.1 hypothetical protein [Chloroflexota bacterium]